MRKLYHVPLAFQSIYECSDEGGENGMGTMGVRFSRGKRRLPGPLYADDLVICGESEW